MTKPIRLNVGDLVRDHMGYHYIIIEVDVSYFADGAPWCYMVGDVTTGEMRTLRFKERALILVRKAGKNESR